MTRVSRVVPLSLILSAAAIAAAACGGSKPTPAPTPAAASNTPSGPNTDSLDQARRDSIARAQRIADSLRAEQDRLAAGVAAARNTITAMIYFDLDKSDLTDQDKASLDQKIPILNANAGLRIRVAGNCDERGSDEYNLALGQRRAEAVVKSLTLLGVKPTQLEATSFGKERPAVPGENEEAWAKNRRAELMAAQ